MDNCIKLQDGTCDEQIQEDVEYVQHSLKPIAFESLTPQSATSDNETKISTATDMGSATHKIIELYWKNFADNQDVILDKMMIFETSQRKSIIENMDIFYKSDIYKLLKDGVEHHFELEFNIDSKTGFIDFIYFDKEHNGWIIVDFKTGVETDEKNKKYQGQLDFYRDVVVSLGYRLIDARLLWLSK